VAVWAVAGATASGATLSESVAMTVVRCKCFMISSKY
jgi:hypothetical protein